VRDDAYMTSSAPSDKFWFCIEHHRVETSEQIHGSNKLGPYPTEDAAAHALETAAERTKAYEAEDAAWNGDG
jgi:hypothetical protein